MEREPNHKRQKTTHSNSNNKTDQLNLFVMSLSSIFKEQRFQDIGITIFCFLDEFSIVRCSCVSRFMHVLAQQPLVWKNLYQMRYGFGTIENYNKYQKPDYKTLYQQRRKKENEVQNEMLVNPIDNELLQEDFELFIYSGFKENNIWTFCPVEHVPSYCPWTTSWKKFIENQKDNNSMKNNGHVQKQLIQQWLKEMWQDFITCDELDSDNMIETMLESVERLFVLCTDEGWSLIYVFHMQDEWFIFTGYQPIDFNHQHVEEANQYLDEYGWEMPKSLWQFYKIHFGFNFAPRVGDWNVKQVGFSEPHDDILDIIEEEFQADVLEFYRTGAGDSYLFVKQPTESSTETAQYYDHECPDGTVTTTFREWFNDTIEDALENEY